MVVRLTQIRRVIINPRTSGTFLFFRATQTLHISIIIIRPYNRYIIRQFQTFIIYIQDLLIWSKSLRNIFSTFTCCIDQHFSLCHQRILKHLFSIRHVIACVHRSIVQPTQCQSVYIFKRSTFVCTSSQNTVHPCPIIDVIPFPHLITFPFACRIEQQRFTMRGTHNDSKTICNQSIFRDTVECHRRIVHSRAEIISLKAKQ